MKHKLKVITYLGMFWLTFLMPGNEQSLLVYFFLLSWLREVSYEDRQQ